MTYEKGIKAQLSEEDIAWKMTKEEFEKQKARYNKKLDKKYTLKCKKCYSNYFYIISEVLYVGSINQENRNLEVNSKGKGNIDVLLCQNCSEEYFQSDFYGIEFI